MSTATNEELREESNQNIDDKLLNKWMLSQGFTWYITDQKGIIKTFFDGYWNIDHSNGTHESVTQLVARRFYKEFEAQRKLAVREFANTIISLSEYQQCEHCRAMQSERSTSIKVINKVLESQDG